MAKRKEKKTVTPRPIEKDRRHALEEIMKEIDARYGEVFRRLAKN
jgi:hypothetical protein